MCYLLFIFFTSQYLCFGLIYVLTIRKYHKIISYFESLQFHILANLNSESLSIKIQTKSKDNHYHVFRR